MVVTPPPPSSLRPSTPPHPTHTHIDSESKRRGLRTRTETHPKALRAQSACDVIDTQTYNVHATLISGGRSGGAGEAASEPSARRLQPRWGFKCDNFANVLLKAV